MKYVDEYLGRVMMFFVSKTGFKKNEYCQDRKWQSKKILLIKFWGMGSIVLTTPAINNLRNHFPGAEISFLTLKNNLPICDQIKLIDQTFTISIANPVSFLLDLIKTIRSLRKDKFDMIFDFEFYTYFSAFIVSILKTDYSFGFKNKKNKRSFVYTNEIVFNDNIHTRDNFLNLVSMACGDESNCIEAESFKSLEERAGGLRDAIRIIVNPNASILAYERRLPSELFVSIINSLIEEFKMRIVLIGSKDESSYVQDIYELISNKSFVENLCGKTSITDLINLINSSACLITNDSGPLHIASALNIPTISFFGPESPDRYGPLSDKNLVFYKNLECSPCMSISNSKTVNCIYDSPKCMESFDSARVQKQISIFLKEILVAKEQLVISN